MICHDTEARDLDPAKPGEPIDDREIELPIAFAVKQVLLVITPLHDVMWDTDSYVSLRPAHVEPPSRWIRSLLAL
jgi:hypothetical protein